MYRTPLSVQAYYKQYSQCGTAVVRFCLYYDDRNADPNLQP